MFREHIEFLVGDQLSQLLRIQIRGSDIVPLRLTACDHGFQHSLYIVEIVLIKEYFQLLTVGSVSADELPHGLH